jgi:hypothetical protein
VRNRIQRLKAFSVIGSIGIVSYVVCTYEVFIEFVMMIYMCLKFGWRYLDSFFSDPFTSNNTYRLSVLACVEVVGRVGCI